jgi:hypothetical protein
VAEAILTGEEIEELSLIQARTFCASGMTGFAKLADDLFVRDSPGDRSNWDRKNKQIYKLLLNAHDNRRLLISKVLEGALQATHGYHDRIVL